jgi:tRNA-splicing ligase RtcB
MSENKGAKMKVLADYGLPIKSWSDDLEHSALSQAIDLSHLPFLYKWVALMPDCHPGYGMPIGGVIACQDVIIPNAVGVDIGCGMRAIKTNIHVDNMPVERIKEIMGKIREAVPVGFKHHDKPQVEAFESEIEIIRQEAQSATHQIGTLGGGNHFIEIQKDEDGFIWVMLHSGSRNIGLKVAGYYHKLAQAMCAEWFVELPNKDLAFLPMATAIGQEYFEAMKFCLNFALSNRAMMMSRICEIIDAGFEMPIDIHHNYASMEHHYGKDVLVHRKGAVLAREGTIGIIPGSMGSFSYIVEGLGNPESFMSSSHGAGRRMGRAEAKRTLNLAAEQEKMTGIVHGLRTEQELDEAPGAYKDIDTVMENQKDLTKILHKLTPLASIKG